MADAAQKAHEVLVEMVAEGNDALMEEFFEKGTLPVEHIMDGLKTALREMRLYPVLCASALHNIGSDQILNFIVDHFPAPTDRGTVTGKVQWQGWGAQDRRLPSRSPPSCSRPLPTRSPAASLSLKCIPAC